MEVQNKYGDQVTFVGVPEPSSDQESITQFVDETGVTAFPHIADPSGEVWAQFDVVEQRTYVIVNDDGTLETIDYGALEQEVQKVIAR